MVARQRGKGPAADLVPRILWLDFWGRNGTAKSLVGSA